MQEDQPNSPGDDTLEAAVEAEVPRAGKKQPRSQRGQWRSFSKVPHLFQYLPSKVYYARVKVNGKVVRQSLKTNVWTTAKLRLSDFLRKKREVTFVGTISTFDQAVAPFKVHLAGNTSIKKRSHEYRERCLNKIASSWPSLGKIHLNEVTHEECRDWAERVSRETASHYYNNIVSTLKMVFAHGIKRLVRQGASPFPNPADGLPRKKVLSKLLTLPEKDQFQQLVENIEKKSGGWGPRAAITVQFLAFSGMRAFSEAKWVVWEDIDWQRKEIIVRGDPEDGTKNSEIRRIPILPDMERLLTQLKTEHAPDLPLTGRILQVAKCEESITTACKEIGIPRITHHDLRHLFATRCIEAGVDIPTVARWLGHKDGGALAMKVYGHLRNEHSQEMARKVRF